MVDKKYHRYIARIFSGHIIAEFAETGTSKYAVTVHKNSGLIEYVNNCSTLAEWFRLLYKYLTNHYRCEYVFKNAIANKILLGRHSINTTTLLTEFRVGKTKADVVLLNGTSTVYEIKTKYDTLKRLSNQLNSYRHVFENIYVVTDELQLPKIVSEIEDDVGIIILTKQYSFKEFRKARSNLSQIKPKSIFESLRKNEYCQIIRDEFGFIPNVPNTKMHIEAKGYFQKLTAERAHHKMVEVLQKRNSNIAFRKFIRVIPHSLKISCLNANLTHEQSVAFQNVLNRKFPMPQYS